MAPKTRKILYIAFLLVFLAVTPLIILYAIGYSLHLSWPLHLNQALQKTGMLIIDTEPAGAKIFINGNRQPSLLSSFFNRNDQMTTPAKIKNLTPGDYDLRLELDGYWPWDKKLTVAPGGSTFAENIILFKDSLPMMMVPGDISNSRMSHDKTHIALLAEGRLIITDLADDSSISTSTSRATDYSSQISWSADDKMLLVGRTILDPDSLQEIVDLDEQIGKTEIIKWDYSDGKKLLSSNSKELISLDVSALKNSILYQSASSSSENIIDFFIRGTGIYLVKTVGKNCQLEIRKGSASRYIPLPYSAKYEFIEDGNGELEILNQTLHSLYIINPDNSTDPLDSIITNYYSGQWSKGKLLYHNDFEIWSFNQSTNGKKLLTRISKQINQVAWYPLDDNYAIFTTENTINILELDERDRRNSTEIIKMEKIGNIFPDSSGRFLFFEGKINDQTGLYKMYIQ